MVHPPRHPATQTCSGTQNRPYSASDASYHAYDLFLPVASISFQGAAWTLTPKVDLRSLVRFGATEMHTRRGVMVMTSHLVVVRKVGISHSGAFWRRATGNSVRSACLLCQPYTAGDAAALAPPARGCARVRPVYTGPGEAGENTGVLTTVMKVQVRRASSSPLSLESHTASPSLPTAPPGALGPWRRGRLGTRRRAEPAAAQEDRGLCWPARRPCSVSRLGRATVSPSLPTEPSLPGARVSAAA